MSLRRSLSLLFAFLFACLLILPAVPSARGRAPITAQGSLTPAPFAHRWAEVAAFDHPADTRTFSDPANGRLYVISGNTAGTNIFDSDTGVFIKRIDYKPLRHDFNADYSRLYMTTGQDFPSDPDATIHVIDTTTLAELRTVTYTCPYTVGSCYIAGLAEGPDGRLYVSRNSVAIFDVLDGATGAILHSVTTSTSPHVTLSLAARDNTLYVGGVFGEHGSSVAGLGLYDISAVAPVRGALYPTDMQPMVRLSPGGDYVLSDDMGRTRLYRTEPFQFLWSRQNGFTEFDGFFANGQLLYHEQPGTDIAYLIVALDPQTGATARSMVTTDGRFNLARPLADGGLAITFGDTFNLYRATDYALAIQTVWNNACPGGPFHDPFDNPNTGWPTIAAEFVSAGYVNGGYQIELRQANRWVAVSRGDYWDKSRILQVSAAQPANQDGTFGLIFGINNDWSDFYTAEVYPAEGKAGLFHFSNGQWETVRIDSFAYGPLEGTRMKITRDPLSGQTILELDSHLTWLLPDFTGRVGLTATSYGAPVNALFDDYRFVDTYCLGPLPEGEIRNEELGMRHEELPEVNWQVGRGQTGDGLTERFAK